MLFAFQIRHFALASSPPRNQNEAGTRVCRGEDGGGICYAWYLAGEPMGKMKIFRRL